MRKVGLLVLFVCVSLIFAQEGLCAQAKIAIVDMSILVKELPDTKIAEEELEKTLEEFEAEQDKLVEELELLKKDFQVLRDEAKSRALSEDVRSEKMKLAEKKLIQLREFELKARETAVLRQKQLASQKERFRKRIMSKITAVVKKYADDMDYTLVMDSAAVSLSGSNAVVYGNDEIDITKDILKLLKDAEKK